MKHYSENNTNNTIRKHKEITIMKNHTTKMDQNTSKHTHFDYQDLPEIAQMKTVFPFCKSVKIGDLFCPVIANNNLMNFIAIDENFVAAARKVKHHAFNPSGSEHGIVKKACDMIIKYPSIRTIIRQDLLHGIYCHERIASALVFTEPHITPPRGFMYTVNQIIQTMIMEVVEASRVSDCTMPYAWSKSHNPGVDMMFETVDHIRARGFNCVITFKLKSALDRIPHARLAQKIQIMFQDKRVADVICALMGLNVSAADDKMSKHVGIPKDSPLATTLGYELYLSELDQEIMRLGIPHVRYNNEIVTFCDTYASAEQIKLSLYAFMKNTLGFSFDPRRMKIKETAHLGFLGLYLHGGKWRFQYKVKNTAASDYLVAVMAYVKIKDDSLLWQAYKNLTRFISFYEGVYALENEIQQLKKWRDEHFTSAIALVEKNKLGLVKLPE